MTRGIYEQCLYSGGNIEDKISDGHQSKIESVESVE